MLSKIVPKHLRKIVVNVGLLSLARKIHLRKYRSGLQKQFEDYQKTGDLSLPEHIVFEPTGKCNLRCRMCYINFDVTTKLKDIDLEMFKTMMNKMPFVKRVTIIGGEAFLKKDMYDMMDYLEKTGRYFSVGTNATLLNEEKVERLAKYKNLTNVNVSIDGMKDIHEQIRGKGTFDKTTANIKLMKKYGIFITVVSVIMKENLNNMKEIIKTVKDAGVDYMEFEYERIYTQAIVDKSAEILGYESNIQNFPLALSNSPMPVYSFEELKSKVKEAQDYAKKIGMTLGFQPFYFPDRLEEYYNRAPKGDHFCKHLFIPRIDCEGNVIFCFAIKKPFGNIVKQSFEDIWYGKELIEFRKKFLSSGVLPICETCEKLVCVEKTRNKPLIATVKQKPNVKLSEEDSYFIER